MARKKPSDIEQDLLRIATFMLFDASLCHEFLAGVHPEVRSLRQREGSCQGFLADQWNAILSINYEPVFSIARDVLLSFPSSPDTERILHTIADAALDAMSSGVLLRHDFMGRVYHKLLLRTTGHYYATYYTSMPAAVLLASLATKTEHPRWRFSTLDDVAEFRMIDPACGSGTLLSAAYSALKDRHIFECTHELDLDRLHEALVGAVIHGWDILDYAAHLSLTTLSLHSGSVPVPEGHVYTVPAGVKGGRVFLGSLEYFRASGDQTQMVGRGFTPEGSEAGLRGSREREIPTGPFDLVLMNPPYSRSAKPNRKFGYSTPDVQRRMNASLQKLTRRLGAEGTGRAGLAAPFMLLGLSLLKDDGRIGAVLPRSMLSGVSWVKVRERYMSQGVLEYIISNYDPGDAGQGIEPWNWSESTDLGEVLVIYRRTQDRSPDHPTTFVNLWRKPRNAAEATITSQRTLAASQRLAGGLADHRWEPVTRGAETVGCVYRVPAHVLETNWMAPCLFAHPDLNRRTLQTLTCDLPMTALRDLAAEGTLGLGIDIRQVKEHFDETDAPTAYPVVWGHQGRMNTLHLSEGHIGYGRPRRGERSASLHGRYEAHLLIAERPHLSTEALLAVWSPRATLATAFWEVRLKDERLEPLLLVWLNSTYGLVGYLSHSTSSMGDIFKTKKQQLEAIRVPASSVLSPVECDEFLRGIVDEPLGPFPAEFAAAARGQGVRRTLDRFLHERLALPGIRREEYELLSRDPVVCKVRL